MTAMSKNQRRKYVRRLESQNRAMKRAANQRPVTCNYVFPSRPIGHSTQFPLINTALALAGALLLVVWLVRAFL